jgi:two-component system response regulator
MSLEKESARPIDILLVEDNEADVKITLRAFEKGHLNNSLNVARDGEEALKFIYGLPPYEDHQQYPRPDLILLDINLPKIDGFSILKEVKENPEYQDIPIIMLTSSRNEGDIIDSFKYGACSYIQKPVSFQEFVEIANGFNFYWQIINRFPSKKRT